MYYYFFVIVLPVMVNKDKYILSAESILCLDCPCEHDHVLNVFEYDILQTACENFTKFTIQVQLGTKMNSLDFQGHCHSWSK